MSRQVLLRGAVLFAAIVAVTAGCRPQQPFYFTGDKDLSHYVGVATEIEFPDVQNPSLDEVEGAGPPLTLTNPDPSSIVDLSLEQAMRIALENSKVMRTLGGISFGPQGSQGTPQGLLSNPDFVNTIYEPAQSETDARFGTEAALSAFDAQFTTSMFWEKNVIPQNVAGIVRTFRPQVLFQDLGTFQSQLSKTSATGGTWSLTHNVNYELNNQPTRGPNPTRAFAAEYAINFEAAVRQPLLQQGGVQFNRIAGPGSVPGFYNGVMIARLRTDVALNDFEAAVRNLVSDVERAYWNLYYAYRRLDAVTAGRDSALRTWTEVHEKLIHGVRGGGAQEEAQARGQYFVFRGSVEQALSNLYKTERLLRYTMGLAATDGRLFRPSDDPTTAEVKFDWYETQCEAMTRAVEIRRQKWRIKQRELELIASKNWVLPRLDAVALYRWRGLGHELIGQDRDIEQNIYENAWASLTSGNFQDWQMGFEFRMPLGFRRELAGVRNAQLNLARERVVLQEQELELSHALSDGFNDLAENYRVSQTNFNRRVAADKEVRAVKAAYEQGAVTLDLLLQAQRRLAEAEADYYRSLVDYNLAITQIHLRKGSLLEYNGVCLAEGPWPGKAYFDARRRARARDAGLYLDYGFTQPRVISRGPYNQAAGAAGTLFDYSAVPAPGQPAEAMPSPTPASLGEPTPAPMPAEKGQPTPSNGATSALRPIPGGPIGGQVGATVVAASPLVPVGAPVQPVGYLAAQRPSGSSAVVGVAADWKGSRQNAAAGATQPSADQSTAGWKSARRP